MIMMSVLSVEFVGHATEAFAKAAAVVFIAATIVSLWRAGH